MSFSLGFFGAGAMAEAIIKGILASPNCRPNKIVAADLSMQRLQQLEKDFKNSIIPISFTTDTKQIVQQCTLNVNVNFICNQAMSSLWL